MPSWKKIIVSGSNAELNQITSSAGINIKTVGSLTNGISFGDGNTGFYETADNDLKFDRAGINVFQANTSSQLAFGVSSLFRNTTGGFLISTGATTTGANYSFRGDENTGIGRPAADQVSVIAGGVQELIVKANTISGSATSTGSFGRTEGTSFRYEFDSAGSFEYNNDQLVYKNGGNEKFKVDNSQMTTEVINTGQIKLGGENKVRFDETSVSFVISQNDGGMQDNLTLTKEGNLTLHRGGLTLAGNISGSATSTGSFGKLLGDGSSLTGISATSDVVDDTSPQLGGDLDLNSNDITGTGNINMVGTHQITGSLNISGSSDPLTVNSAGSDGIGLLLQGDVVSQTPLIKFKSAGGNLPAGGTIGFTNGGFQFTSTVTSTGTINANGGFATSLRGSQNAIESTNGGNAGIGFTGLGGNAGIDFQTSDTTRLDIAVDGTVTIVGDTVIGGDLTVNGDTTTISTSNILVQDAFGFFATGSAGTNVDAGIIVQSGSFVDSGSAFYHDISKERWSVGKGIASTATNVPDSKWGGFVATVYTASASPVGSSPKYGVGEIHVDDDGEIYIYS